MMKEKVGNERDERKTQIFLHPTNQQQQNQAKQGSTFLSLLGIM